MKSRSKQIMVIVASLLISVGSSLTTYCMMTFINEPSKNIFLMLAVSMLLATILLPVRTFLINLGCTQIKTENKEKLIEKAVQKDMLFLESPEYSSFINQIKNSKVFTHKFFSALSIFATTASTVVAFFIMLFWQTKALAIISISISFGLVYWAFGVNYKLSRLMYDFWQKYMENTRRFNYFADVLTKKEYVEEKKVFRYRSFFVDLFDKEFDRATCSNKQVGKQRAVLEAINDLIYALFALSQFGFLIACYYGGRVSLGFFVSFIPFSMGTFAAICSSFSAMNDFIQIKKLRQDIQKFFDENQKRPLSLAEHGLILHLKIR